MTRTADRGDRRGPLGVIFVVAAGLLVAAAASLLVPARALRSNEGERPTSWRCGTPFAYILGASEGPWRAADGRPVPTTVPGQEPAPTESAKSDACKRAMAPRLAVTTWALLAGLVLLVGERLASRAR